MGTADNDTALCALPLVVDMDGTVLLTDMLHESAVGLLRSSPTTVLRIPLWLARGKAVLKAELAERFVFDPGLLPFNEPLVAWLRTERAAGRRLILCTASDGRIAQAVAAHLGIFDEVLASDGETNLSGEVKARLLARRFGQGGFAYAGNAATDLPVWREARAAVVINAPESLAVRVAQLCPVERSFAAVRSGLGVHLRMLRLHQWLKNLLLAVPLAAAHRLAEPERWPPLLMAILAFSLCASAVYLVNDLLDLESDRRHLRKCERALASGRVSLRLAVLLVPLLLACALGLASAVGQAFWGWLGGYFLLTCGYSLVLKRAALLDCLTLAILYTLRIVAGGAATGVPLSYWLLSFSVFLFLSLAFVKRYAELQTQPPEAGGKLAGRGYRSTDAPLVLTLGMASGFASALVLSLYLNSEAVVRMYRTPECIWATVPVLLFWISHMWLTAHRGGMHDDPLVFAVKDKASLLAGLLFVAALVAGTVALPW
ncbi:MAG: UbiA family prenyltransferase [Humidesulfovibrio sp.]|nr:UbiA family prenyltransferase [Humidesulfovibrio sp.]